MYEHRLAVLVSCVDVKFSLENNIERLELNLDFLPGRRLNRLHSRTAEFGCFPGQNRNFGFGFLGNDGLRQILVHCVKVLNIFLLGSWLGRVLTFFTFSKFGSLGRCLFISEGADHWLVGLVDMVAFRVPC